MTYQTSITKEEIMALEPFVFEGDVIEIISLEGVKKALTVLKQYNVLGFDTETRPAFQKGEVYTPALLQLATPTQSFVFRLKFFPFPPELEELLCELSILKVGVGIKDDLNGLRRISQGKLAGFFDLSDEVTKRGFQEKGLRALTAIFLGKRLLKGSKKTNWEREELTEAQILYAATDAVVGLLIYQKLFPRST